MKINSLLLLLLLGFVSLTAVSQNNKDKNGLKQGLWKVYYPNKSLKYKGQFVNDKPVGEFVYYYETGEIMSIIKHSKNVARAKVYYITGDIKARGKYIAGEKDSTWHYFGANGVVRAEEFYKNGSKEGDWKVFYDDGTVAEFKEYTNGQANGSWNTYYANGKKKMEAKTVNDALEGKAVYYDYNGKLKIIANYKHDVKHGKWYYYKNDGKTLEKTEAYKNGYYQGNPDDKIIKEEDINKEKQDMLEFEDLYQQQPY